MKKTILAATMLMLASMVAPRHAASQVSIDIEKPGLSLHAGPPVYGPPVVVGPPPAVVYQGYPGYYGPPDKHYWKHWKHWHKHGWHHHHDDD